MFTFLITLISFYLGQWLKGQRADEKERGMSEIKMHNVKSSKNQKIKLG